MRRSEALQAMTPLGLAYRELDLVFQRSHVTVHQFDRLLTQLDNSIKATYQNSMISDAERRAIEKDMLVSAQVPVILIDPVSELLTTSADALKQEVNVAELYLTDFSWLGLTDDQSSKKWRQDHPLDAMRKTDLRKDARVRRCIRCASLMEDILPSTRQTVLVSLQRNCFCGGSWMVLGEDENVGPRGQSLNFYV